MQTLAIWTFTFHQKLGCVYYVVNLKGNGAVHKLCHLGRGEGGSPKDNLVNRPYLIKKTTGRGGGGQKLPILKRHSLWTAPNA